MRHPVPRLGVLVAAAILLAATGPADGVTTHKWTLRGADLLEQGTLDGTILRSDGRVARGPSTRTIPDLGKEVWDSVVRDDVIWAVTGTPARLRFIEPGVGSGVASWEPSEDVLALTAVTAVGSSIVCGSLPDGRLHVYDALEHEHVRTIDLDADYVWEILPAGRSRVIVATGPRGRVFEVDLRQEAVREVANLGRTNVFAIARGDSDGVLYAGTSGRARLVRIENGRRRVLWDFGSDHEIAALARDDDGRLHVAVNRVEVQQGQQAAGDPTMGRGGVTEQQAVQGGQVQLPGGIQGAGNTAVVEVAGRILTRDPDGGMEELFASEDEAILDLAIDRRGRLLAATGRRGRVHAFDGPRRRATLLDLAPNQVLTLALGPDGNLRFAGTGNAGTGILVEDAPAPDATWTSPVLDAGYHAAWGTVEWSASGPLVVQTRSGNTSEPGEAWSDWSVELLDTPTRVPSEPARFLQVRAVWGPDAGDAVLRQMEIAYLPRNRRPRLREVVVEAASAENGGSGGRGGSSSGSSSRGPSGSSGSSGSANGENGEGPTGVPVTVQEHADAKLIRWTADAVDGDDLAFHLEYRPVGEDAWMPLVPGPRRADPVRETSWTWPTDGVPDGHYVVRVTATDEPSNPPAEARTDVLESDPFLVDNRRPQVDVHSVELADGTLRIEGVAEDSYSDIARIEVSVDGGPWTFVYPGDRIFDHRVEPFAITLERGVPADGGGPRTVAVRARDSDGNVGVTRRTVR